MQRASLVGDIDFKVLMMHCMENQSLVGLTPNFLVVVKQNFAVSQRLIMLLTDGHKSHLTIEVILHIAHFIKLVGKCLMTSWL